MNSTFWIFASSMRFTAFEPPPPHPITLITVGLADSIVVLESFTTENSSIFSSLPFSPSIFSKIKL
jgi:hypothetical protein